METGVLLSSSLRTSHVPERSVKKGNIQMQFLHILGYLYK